MKKKNYIKPTVKVIVLRHQSALLVGSGEGKTESPYEPEDEPVAPKPLLYDGIFG